VKIQKLSLFFNVDERLLEEIEGVSYFKKYRRGEIIFFEGEVRDHFFGVLKGGVLLYDTDKKGEIIPRMEVEEGGIFGLIAKIQNRPFCLSAMAQKETEIVGIPYKKFAKHLPYPPFSDRVIKMLSYQIYQQMELSKLVKLPALQRVAYTLLHFPDKFRRLKWYLIAKELNMTPETLSRILSKFRQQQVIKIADRQVEILDRDYLERLLREEGL
jgi:CRP/FNR family transcriptional regulator